MTEVSARLERSIAVALSVAVVLPLAFMPIVPTHDGFQHLLHGYLWNHLGDPGAGYDRFLERGSPLTAWGFTWLFAPLERVLPWRAAYQASFALLALGLAWGARAFIRSLARRPTAWGLLGFALAFPWVLYMGFLPFVAAHVVGLWLLALVLRRPDPSAIDHLLFGAGLLVVAMMHTYPAILVGGIVLAVRVAESPRRVADGAWTCLAAIPAAAIALLSWSAGAETVASANADAVNHQMWQPWGVRLLDLGRTSIGGPWWRWAPPLLAALAGAILGVARGPARIRAIAALAFIGVALALALPFHRTSWEYIAPRSLMLGLVCGWAALGAVGPQLPRLRAGLLAAFLFGAIGWVQVHNAYIARCADDALAPAAELRADPERPSIGWQLPIVFAGPEMDTAMAYGKPLANIGHVYVIELGGMTPYLFASAPTMHQHVFRDDVPLVPMPGREYFGAVDELADRPAVLAAVRTSLLQAGASYDLMVVVNDSETEAMALERGYAPVASAENAAAYTFEGCPIRFAAPGLTSGAVAWGWYPLLEAAGTRPLSAADQLPTPCGPVWFNALAADRSAYPCANGDPDGRIIAPLTRGETRPVVCPPRP